jgi:hypothetical protein
VRLIFESNGGEAGSASRKLEKMQEVILLTGCWSGSLRSGANKSSGGGNVRALSDGVTEEHESIDIDAGEPS